MNNPARLSKKDLPDNKVELWIINHTHIFLPLAFIILFILFAWLIYAVAGASVESGNYYYHLRDVI